MEIWTLGYLKPLATFLTMSCLSAISILSHLNYTYLNNDEHMHLDKRTGNTDILDMAFISPNLTNHDIQFLIGDGLGSDHLPIEISIDA